MFLVLSTLAYGLLLTPALPVECEPVWVAPKPEPQPVFSTTTPYQQAYNRVLAGGTATVTLDGVTYDCWLQNGNPVMQARATVAPIAATCVGGNCSSTGSGVPTSRIRVFR